MKPGYWLQVAIAVDQLGNALRGGWADETLSARAYRETSPGWVRFRKALDHIQTNHCRNAYMAERLRLQSPPEER